MSRSEASALPEFAAIWAQARGGVIGRAGSMPWHCPADFAFFKDRTMGFPVVMGRTTWESFPARFRPLPGRRNVVLSRSVPAGTVQEHDGAAWVSSLSEALEQSAGAPGGDRRIWLLGGATVYADALDRSDLPRVRRGRLTRVLVTELDVEVPGDALAPRLGSEWTARELGSGVDPRGAVAGPDGVLVPHPVSYRFLEWTR